VRGLCLEEKAHHQAETKTPPGEGPGGVLLRVELVMVAVAVVVCLLGRLIHDRRLGGLITRRQSLR
jgi:hypothetical protein